MLCVKQSNNRRFSNFYVFDLFLLIFHFWSKNIVIVKCTNEIVYVWNLRKSNYVFHKLQHEKSISNWNNKYDEFSLSCEQNDAKTIMTLWSLSKNHLYTTTTNEIMKFWNVSTTKKFKTSQCIFNKFIY